MQFRDMLGNVAFRQVIPAVYSHSPLTVVILSGKMSVDEDFAVYSQHHFYHYRTCLTLMIRSFSRLMRKRPQKWERICQGHRATEWVLFTSQPFSVVSATEELATPQWIW